MIVIPLPSGLIEVMEPVRLSVIGHLESHLLVVPPQIVIAVEVTDGPFEPFEGGKAVVKKPVHVVYVHACKHREQPVSGMKEHTAAPCTMRHGRPCHKPSTAYQTPPQFPALFIQHPCSHGGTKHALSHRRFGETQKPPSPE
jgi:hypothetical protein